MIVLNKSASHILPQDFPGYSTVQTWVLEGDVEVQTETTENAVAVIFVGGSPGLHRIGIKLSGVDPELLDTIELTIGE